MENIATIWQQYNQEVLLALLGSILLLMLWMILIVRNNRRTLNGFWKALDNSVLEQQYELESIQKLILDTVIKGQVLTQDSLHKEIFWLQEKLGLTHTALQRQLLEDASELKLGLVGRLSRLGISRRFCCLQLYYRYFVYRNGKP